MLHLPLCLDIRIETIPVTHSSSFLHIHEDRAIIDVDRKVDVFTVEISVTEFARNNSVTAYISNLSASIT